MEISLFLTGLETEIQSSILEYGKEFITQILIMANSPQLEVKQD
ncbi:hypothetical protein [Vallitalea pronyensis]